MKKQSFNTKENDANNNDPSTKDLPIVHDDFKNIVKNSIENLSKSKIYFGNEKLFRSGAGELSLRDELIKILSKTSSDEWKWHTEAKYKTKSLINSLFISIDIVGVWRNTHLYLIELKYVPIAANRNVPQDFPSFPYDVLHDCLKIEIVLSKNIPRATPHLSHPSIHATPVFGVVIGITNFGQYWDERVVRDGGWGKNYIRSIQCRQHNKILKTELDFTKLAHYKRPHLSFGLDWIIDWKDYDRNFRFVTLMPPDEIDEISYGHPADDPHYVPFLKEEIKKQYLLMKSHIKNK